MLGPVLGAGSFQKLNSRRSWLRREINILLLSFRNARYVCTGNIFVKDTNIWIMKLLNVLLDVFNTILRLSLCKHSIRAGYPPEYLQRCTTTTKQHVSLSSCHITHKTSRRCFFITDKNTICYRKNTCHFYR